MMIFEVIAISLLLFLFGIVIWESRRQKTIPGCPPSHPKTGNIGDIAEAGSLHNFLTKLHGRFGDIASFWWGTRMAVSIASPELFGQHCKPFDRPRTLFEFIEPLITGHSIELTNGPEGRRRRNTTNRAYSHGTVNQAYLPIFLKIVEEFAEHWKCLPRDQHIPLSEGMFNMAVKAIAEASYGQFFDDDKEVSKFKDSYDICMEQLERTLKGDPSKDESQHRKLFDTKRAVMVDLVKEAIKERSNSAEQGDLLLDILIRNESEDVIFADAITYFVAGFHTTALMMTWAIYYLALHEDVQERCYQELHDVLGDEPVHGDAIKELVYLRQVLDETLRCSQISLFTARYSDEAVELGGYNVPAGTPVVHALGVSQHNEQLWKDPTEFDPDRFSPENRNKLPPYAFEPFGFAGKRKCPGYRFTYAEGIVFLSVLLRKFKIRLVPGQTVTKAHGFVTRPKQEIWITIEDRK